MQIGICNLPEETAGLPPESFDFLEVNIQSFFSPTVFDDKAFESKLEEARHAICPVKTANWFLPGSLKCMGPEADREAILRYAAALFARAERLDIDTVVFGSGWVRSRPEGFSHAQAIPQFVDLLKQLGPLAGGHGVTLVIEPLKREACNFINSLREGAEVVELCDHPAVRLLADTYHMGCENEPPEEIIRYGHLIKHFHVAELNGRFFPGKSKEDFLPYLRALKQVGYQGRIALECSWDNLAEDVGPSIQYLRQQLAEAGF